MARFEVSTIIRQVWPLLPPSQLSAHIGKPFDDNADKPFLSYTINAPSTPLLIQEYVENQIRPKLAQIKGFTI